MNSAQENIVCPNTTLATWHQVTPELLWTLMNLMMGFRTQDESNIFCRKTFHKNDSKILPNHLVSWKQYEDGTFIF